VGPAESKDFVCLCSGLPFPPRRVGHPYQTRTPPKRKKPRTSFSRLQICELEKRFHKQVRSSFLSQLEDIFNVKCQNRNQHKREGKCELNLQYFLCISEVLSPQLKASEIRMPFQLGWGERTEQSESAACQLSTLPTPSHIRGEFKFKRDYVNKTRMVTFGEKLSKKVL
jgi:hypothetical protein